MYPSINVYTKIVQIKISILHPEKTCSRARVIIYLSGVKMNRFSSGHF